MRVISGSLKGRIIKGFDLEGTRPTMDRVKESLFAMIQEKINNSTCLDLFAGSGNLGIEAISEGASKAYFVDQNKKTYETIISNINNFNIKDKCIVYKLDYKKALEELKSKKFDIIFLDPPYKTDYIEKSIEIITNNNILNDDGIIVCESDSIDKIVCSNNYELIKEKKYGDKYVVILKKM